MTQANRDFTSFVLGKVDPDAEFQPSVYYDPDGDCIEFVASPDSFYAERIDDLVTVYYRQGSEDIVGALFKGVTKHLAGLSNSLPGFRVEIEDGRVKLSMLLTARLLSSRPDESRVRVRTYRKLIAVAEQTEAEAEVSLA